MLLFVSGYAGFNPALQENSLQELPDAVSFVGFYFKYQFPSWYRSKSSSLQVTEAGNDALPTWLYLNRSAVTLEGVPSATDEGFTYLQIFIRDIQEGTFTSNDEGDDVFAINVQFPGLAPSKTAFSKKSGSIFAKNSRTQQDEYGVHYCQSYEARFFVSLMLAFSLEKSTAEQRVHIIKSFSDFLSKEPHEIVLSVRSNDVIRRLRGVVVLESKLEQAENSSLPSPGDSQVSWSCSVGVEFACQATKGQNFLSTEESKKTSQWFSNTHAYPYFVFHDTFHIWVHTVKLCLADK
ncbi:Dystroglycan [Holothuria leucospilota]|uniref:Dystroglycan n=1 Tax=Holothuria leucospilota TaxID=206669 RepID=A0A9Q0YB57_HOLLE|nr:Dystroglycan [Holothuria leucospilota]